MLRKTSELSEIENRFPPFFHGKTYWHVINLGIHQLANTTEAILSVLFETVIIFRSIFFWK